MGSAPADQDLAVAGFAGSEPSHASPSKTSTPKNLPPTIRGVPRRGIIGTCVSCGWDIPIGVGYQDYEAGTICIFCEYPEHAESKHVEFYVKHGNSHPVRVKKRGVHTRFGEDGGVHTRFPNDDLSSASESSIESFGSASEFFS